MRSEVFIFFIFCTRFSSHPGPRHSSRGKTRERASEHDRERKKQKERESPTPVFQLHASTQYLPEDTILLTKAFPPSAPSPPRSAATSCSKHCCTSRGMFFADPATTTAAGN